MKKKINLCVVITARPSYARMKTALQAIKESEYLNLHIIATGSLLLDRYGNPVNVIKQDGFDVISELHTLFEGEDLISGPKSTAIQLMELTTEFIRIKPDAVITIADRYETISTAIAASYMNIPLIHIQGGEITGSIDEKVRHAITKLSDLHLVSTEDAKKRVIKMGEEEKRVITTGCPSIDLAKLVIEKKPYLEDDVWKKYTYVGSNLSLKEKYIVLMHHPVTTQYEMNKDDTQEILNTIEFLDINVFCFWPNPDAGANGVSNAIRTFREKTEKKNIAFFKNIEPEDFIRLLNGAECLIGNSSVGIRESSFLGLPVINIGNRQQFRLRGKNVIDVESNRQQILPALGKQIEHGKYEKNFIYGNGNAGINITKAILDWDFSLKKAITY